MCGRFTIYSDLNLIAEKYGVTPGNNDFILSYNVPPTTTIPVLCEPTQNQRLLIPMRWGLIPGWSKDLKKFNRPLINARVETIFDKPSFRKNILTSRCLIPTDGYYEWREEGEVKQPYLIRLKSGEPFVMAGIWNEIKTDDRVIASCAIVTTEANEKLNAIHNRMPLILNEKLAIKWLDPRLLDKLQIETQFFSKSVEIPYDNFEFYAVNRKVNKPNFDNPDCLNQVG